MKIKLNNIEYTLSKSNIDGCSMCEFSSKINKFCLLVNEKNVTNLQIDACTNVKISGDVWKKSPKLKLYKPKQLKL